MNLKKHYLNKIVGILGDKVGLVQTIWLYFNLNFMNNEYER